MIGPWKPDEKRVCKLVVIGRNIDKAYIREEFDKSVAIKTVTTENADLGHAHGVGASSRVS